MTEIIHSLRQCVQRINDDSVATEITQKLDELQQVSQLTHQRLQEQQKQLTELSEKTTMPNTLAAVWPGLCYDPAV
jgi:hypothetical protein